MNSPPCGLGFQPERPQPSWHPTAVLRMFLSPLSPGAVDHTSDQSTRNNGAGTGVCGAPEFRASLCRSQSRFPLVGLRNVAVVFALSIISLFATCDVAFAQYQAIAVAAEDSEPADAGVDDDTNLTADVIMLDELPAEEGEEEEDEDEWEGRNFEKEEEEEEDKEEEAVVAVQALPVMVAPMAFNAGQQKIEVDEDDPFADILKKQPQFAAHVQQTRNAVEAVVGGDLTFAARVCEVNDEDREKMRQLARVELRGIMEIVAKQLKAQFGFGAFMRNGKIQSAAVVRHEAVERVLTGVYWKDKANGQEKPPQIEKWEAACVSRDLYSNEANARVFVAALSRQLFLDKAQRKALTKSITECWKEDWVVYIDIMVNNPEYFPNLPSKAMKPHLSDEQYQMWKSMPKSQMGSSQWQLTNTNGLFVRNDGQPQLNPWFHDDEEIEKAKGDKPPNGVLGRLNAVIRNAAVVARAQEAKDRKQPREEAKEPVSLHKLGLLGMGSGASIIKQAIKDGADVNDVAEGGITPLHVAAVNGAEKNVKVLIDSGADCSKKTEQGKTAADLARDGGYEKLAKLIEKAAGEADDVDQKHVDQKHADEKHADEERTEEAK